MEVGRILGNRYKIEERIGSGGMSVVYRAHEIGLDREVAVKVLISTLSGDPQLIERFNREAKTIANLQHNSIIPIYYYGVEDDFGTYLVMPLLQGGTLEQRIHQLDILPSLTEVGELAQKLGSALQYAHDKGVVHRDIKFSNIMFDDAGSPYVMDFGIAKLLNTTNITGTGMTVGTPNFMPPEQWRNDEITPAVDQYAFAVLLFAMLTKRMPFEADSAPALMYQHLQEDPPFASDYRIDVPQSIDDALHKALSKEPAERFQSIEEFTKTIAMSALTTTREYSGFFKAPIAQRAKKPSETGFRQQTVMPNTPTEMVADTRFGGDNTQPPHIDGKTTPLELQAQTDHANRNNNTIMYGTIVGVLLIGIIIIGAGFVFFQSQVSTQQTQTRVANNNGTATMGAFQAQAVVESESPTITPEPSSTNTDEPTPDATLTQLAIDQTQVSIEQTTQTVQVASTGTASSIVLTENSNLFSTSTALANSLSTATADANLLRTQQANIRATTTAESEQNTAEARSAQSTQLAQDRNGTQSAVGTLQANIDATSTANAQVTNTPTIASDTAIPIAYGELVSEAVTNQDTVRWSFTGSSGDVISIAARSNDFNPVVEIFFNGMLLVADSDSGYQDNARIYNYELIDTGAFSLVLHSDNRTPLNGDYTVGITEMQNCDTEFDSRLVVGDFARVTIEGTRNNVRSQPNSDSDRVGQIPNGGVFTVLQGPVCSDDFTWYRVDYNGLIGWTAEAGDGDYWLELLPEDDEPVLAAGGRGLTNGQTLRAGEFQVETFCTDLGLTVESDGIDWFCVDEDGDIQETLSEADFSKLCQLTYDIDEAFARQDGEGSQPAYRWRCYFIPE